MSYREFTAMCRMFCIGLLATCWMMAGCASGGGGGSGNSTLEDPPGDCTNDAACDDGDECTADSCDNGTCVHESIDGCGSDEDVIADFELEEGLGEFDMQAGVPAENRGTGSFDITCPTAENGSIQLDPDAITVLLPDAGSGKVSISQQGDAAFRLAVTIEIAPVHELDTVCGSGDEYGPFDVGLDESYVPVSIQPHQVTVTQKTADLISQGEISICIRVEGDFDATVHISRLRFQLSCASNDGGEAVATWQLEVNDRLRAVCAGISDGEIEAILETIAQYREDGQGRDEASADAALTCAVAPPGGNPTACAACYDACVSQIYSGA